MAVNNNIYRQALIQLGANQSYLGFDYLEIACAKFDKNRLKYKRNIINGLCQEIAIKCGTSKERVFYNMQDTIRRIPNNNSIRVVDFIIRVLDKKCEIQK